LSVNEIRIEELTEEELNELKPNQLIKKIRKDIEEGKETRLGKDYESLMDKLVREVFSEKSHFLLEILQNAEDAINDKGINDGRLKIDLYEKEYEDSYIRIQHNGKKFSNKDVDSICGVRSEKSPNENYVGFMGIGFKSVFRACDTAKIFSGDEEFQFEFRKEDDEKLWMIKPKILTENPYTVNERDFTTTFILNFKNKDSLMRTKEHLEKFGKHLFLFLENITEIELNIHKKDDTTEELNLEKHETGPEHTEHVPEPHSTNKLTIIEDGETEKFKVYKFIVEVDSEVEEDEDTIRHNRNNISKREIIIAFLMDKSKTKLKRWEEKERSVYSFLPLSDVRSGFPFIIQADFIVQPGRTDVDHDVEWNRWLIEEIRDILKNHVIQDILSNKKLRDNYPAVLKPDESLGGTQTYEKLFKKDLVDEIDDYFKNEEIPIPDKNKDLCDQKNIVIAKPQQIIVELLGSDGLKEYYEDNDLRYIDDDFNYDEDIKKRVKEEKHILKLEDIGKNVSFLNKKKEDLDFLSKYYSNIFTYLESNYENDAIIIDELKDINILNDDNEFITLGEDIYYDVIPERVTNLKEKENKVKDKLNKYHFLNNDLVTKLENKELGSLSKDKYLDILKECKLTTELINELEIESGYTLSEDSKIYEHGDGWIIDGGETLFNVVISRNDLKICQNKLEKYGLIDIIEYEKICNDTILEEISVDRDYNVNDENDIEEYLNYCKLLVGSNLEKIDFHKYNFWVLTNENQLKKIEKDKDDVLMSQIYDINNNQSLDKYKGKLDIPFISDQYLGNNDLKEIPKEKLENWFKFLKQLKVKTDENYEDVVRRRIYQGKLRADSGVHSPKPDSEKAVLYARLVKEYYGDIGESSNVWVLTDNGVVDKSSNIADLFFGSAYNPEHDYQQHREYLEEMNHSFNFLSEEYLKDNDRKGDWRDFFKGQVNSKTEGKTKIVEKFGEGYTKKHLSPIFEEQFGDDFIGIEFIGGGNKTPYDAEIKFKNNKTCFLEVKGRTESAQYHKTADNLIELTPKETDKAISDSKRYFVSIVTNIPKDPRLHVYMYPKENAGYNKARLKNDGKEGQWEDPQGINFESFFKD